MKVPHFFRETLSTPLRKLHSERGSILILVVLSVMIIVGSAGLAVDVGRLYAAKAELSRTVDAAALAGVLEFNGTAGGLTNAQTKAQAYVTQNDPTLTNGCPMSVASAACVTANGAAAKLTIDARKSVRLYFLPIFGINTASVGGHAVAGFGQGKMDLVLVTDDTGTMNSGCNGSVTDPTTQTNAACPIKQARDGANALLDMLPLGAAGNQTQVAAVPFRGCYSNNSVNRYNPVAGEANFAVRGCILQSQIASLTSNKATLQTTINALSAPGGYPGTNICLGMYEGYQRLIGAGAQSGPTLRRVMVILTDGDQSLTDGAQNVTRGGSTGPGGGNATPPGTYDTGTWPSGQSNGSAPAGCRQTSPLYANSGLNNTGTQDQPKYDTRINQMDLAAYNYAQTLKTTNNVEIYVLRFSNPATDLPAATLCDTSKITGLTGTSRSNSSDAWDQNLARCLASSSAGTNDHYFFAATPGQIVTDFQLIANQIATRLIE